MSNKVFSFESIEEFIYFSNNSKDTICSCILSSLTTAFEENEANPILFEISLKDMENSYELSLDRSQWETALEKCLEILVEESKSDEAIDTYLLLQTIK